MSSALKVISYPDSWLCQIDEEHCKKTPKLEKPRIRGSSLNAALTLTLPLEADNPGTTRIEAYYPKSPASQSVSVTTCARCGLLLNEVPAVCDMPRQMLCSRRKWTLWKARIIPDN